MGVVAVSSQGPLKEGGGGGSESGEEATWG